MSRVDAIEQAIDTSGANAPRVRDSDLTANVVDVEYVKHVSKSGQVLRWAVITTVNGFAVTGRPSVSVSPQNDREDIGQAIAYENARLEMWPLMGYALKERLHAGQPVAAEAGRVAMVDTECSGQRAVFIPEDGGSPRLAVEGDPAPHPLHAGVVVDRSLD